jgi:hypothetical protein
LCDVMAMGEIGLSLISWRNTLKNATYISTQPE